MAGDSLYVDQFVSSTADLKLDGRRLKVTQTTDYPWDGKIEITMQPEAPQDMTLHIRVPG